MNRPRPSRSIHAHPFHTKLSSKKGAPGTTARLRSTTGVVGYRRRRCRSSAPAFFLLLLLVVVVVVSPAQAQGDCPSSKSAAASSSMSSSSGEPPQDLHDAFSRPPKSWPDLVGMDGEEAKKRILEEMPGLTVVVLPEGSAVTMDYRLNRVRIFVDKDGKVASIPSQG